MKKTIYLIIGIINGVTDANKKTKYGNIIKEIKNKKEFINSNSKILIMNP